MEIEKVNDNKYSIDKDTLEHFYEFTGYLRNLMIIIYNDEESELNVKDFLQELHQTILKIEKTTDVNSNNLNYFKLTQ